MDELHQIQKDIQELKINVATIGLEVSEMKKNVSDTIVKISESLILLATITEKMNANVEEHKAIHIRIDDLDHTVKELVMSQIILKKEHDDCQKQKASDIKEEKDAEQNSITKRVKGAVFEWSAIGVVALILYTLYKNLGDFLRYIKG